MLPPWDRPKVPNVAASTIAAKVINFPPFRYAVLPVVVAIDDPVIVVSEGSTIASDLLAEVSLCIQLVTDRDNAAVFGRLED